MPSISTISTEIRMHLQLVREGEFRFQALKEYLQERSIPNIIRVSEDATRITGRIQYDQQYDQVSGFTPPLSSDGVPIVGSFPAETSEMIEKYFSSSKIGNYAYVIMAQPLHEGFPALCLSVFSSDNRFMSSQVISRWK